MKQTSKMTFAARALCASSLLGLMACVACSGSSGSSSSAAPLPDGISVTPASELRQGQSGITISYERAAGGLSAASAVTLGDLDVTVDPSSTDTHLLLTVSVPHGADPGSRSLTFQSAAGMDTEADLVNVTPITVGPSGNDSDDGTTSAPYRTLKQALAVAGAGDTCIVQSGTYDATSGETWSYPVTADLTISGDAAGGTVLQGQTGNVDALEPSATVTLQNLTFADFDTAISIPAPATVTLKDVVIRGAGQGISEGGVGTQVTLSGGSIDSSAAFGIEVSGICDSCSLDIDGTKLTATGDEPIVHVTATGQHGQYSLKNAQIVGGVFVSDATATMTVDGSTLTGNGQNAGLNFGGATLTATGSTFVAGSAPYGINLASGTMTLTDDTVKGNEYGVYQLDGTSKLRNTKISGYSSIGLYFASGDLDLGTATEAGSNSFSGASGAHGLYVDTMTSPLTCSDTSFDGVVPPTSVVVDSGTDLLIEPSEYILTPGKTISFYSVP